MLMRRAVDAHRGGSSSEPVSEGDLGEKVPEEFRNG